MQLNALADIARCVATTPLEDDRSTPYLLTCLGDLRVVIERRKFDALTVETFGTRIEKLIRWVSCMKSLEFLLYMQRTSCIMKFEFSFK